MLKLVYMNEGENTGMPNTPVFSSPNTPPDNGQDAPDPAASVAAAAASLPGEDPSQPAGIISSGNAAPTGARPRFGFSRKFKSQPDAQPTQSAFKNAPDYFNQAVGDIVLADENAAAQKKKVKKIALIAVVALIVIGGGLTALLLLNQASKPSANKVKTAFNRYANYALYGEEKDSDIGEYSDFIAYTIRDKFSNVDENYNKHLKELFDKFYDEYNASVDAGTYEKGTIDAFKSVTYDAYLSIYMENTLSFQEIDNKYGEKGAEKLRDEVTTAAQSYERVQTSAYVAAWQTARLSYITYLSYENDYPCYFSAPNASKCDSAPSKDGIELANNAYESYLSAKAEQENQKKMSREGVIKYLFNYKGIIENGKEK